MSYPKKCSKCRTWKTSDDFSPEGNGRLRNQCRECRSAAAKARYRANPEPARARELERYHRRKQLTREQGREPPPTAAENLRHLRMHESERI